MCVHRAAATASCWRATQDCAYAASAIAEAEPALPTCRVDNAVCPALVAQLNELLGTVLQSSGSGKE